ncbi:MAG: hypothetical protein FI703_09520 [SAR202 cluster bacterium]|nr:hypothetical protein [SAR202 cluster bacterium]|tara:strand:- start:925 stop:1170 length:246 start_codon:yes stop_codon:yes gene_type:complete
MLSDDMAMGMMEAALQKLARGFVTGAVPELKSDADGNLVTLTYESTIGGSPSGIPVHVLVHVALTEDPALADAAKDSIATP